MDSGGHISRSILPLDDEYGTVPEVPTEDSNAESNQRATMKELSSLTELMDPSKRQQWSILGSVISADTMLKTFFQVRGHFAAEWLLQYPLLYDITFDDIKERLRVYRDIPFEDIYSEMKEMKGQDDDEILRAIFDKCDSFKTFWSLMHLPHLDYENRCCIFNLAEHNLLQEEKKDAIKKFHQEIQDNKDDDDLFDALLEMKDLFQLGEKLDFFHERIPYLKCLEVSNELFKATPHELGMHLDDLIMRNNIAFTTRSLTPGVPFFDLIGVRVENMAGAGTTGYVVKDRSHLNATTVGHVLLEKRPQWWKEDVKHSSQCMYNSNRPCSCDLKCSIGNEVFEARIFYHVGDGTNSGHETALLEPIKRDNTGSRQTKISDDQKPLLTLECRGNIRNPQSGSIVYKIGQTSGLTKGIVQGCPKTFSDVGTGMLLNNQIVVKWHGKQFSKPGDSGAPVFFVEGKEIIAVGVVEAANDKCEVSYVSPITCSYPLVPFRLEAYEDIPKPKNPCLIS